MKLMQLKNFLFENGSFILFIAFSLSLFVWLLALIFLFDYVDYGVYKPAYVGFGWLFALVAGFILLVTSGILSLFKVKTPKVFAVKEHTGKHGSYPSSMSICGEMIQGYLNMNAIACKYRQ